jgi:protein-S-isoprenylcysteine O-methyltransferase Ste14
VRNLANAYLHGLDALGVVVLAGGLALRSLVVGLAYIKRGGKGKKVYADALVTDGIFAHSRNPLYLGNILILCGLALCSSLVLLRLPLLIFATWHRGGGGLPCASSARPRRLLPAGSRFVPSIEASATIDR